MFEIKTFPYSHDYTRKDFARWELPNKYHCVYILENGRDAYIGESGDVADRGYKHRKKYRQYKFERIHVIAGTKMEISPGKHYEKLLIKLMKVDKKFNILNGNLGTQVNYCRKNEFELHFDKLWEMLEEKRLVKHKNFQLILNSNAYKYSPYSVLTQEQSRALTSIVNVLNSGETLSKDGNRPIRINGEAGTGKTVVATSLFYYLRNHDDHKNKKIVMVEANVQMRNILKKVFKATGEGLHQDDVVSPIELTKRKYDIVICDEVQALRRDKNLVSYKKNFTDGNKRLGLDNTHDELDWILKQSTYPVLFYDNKQRVKRSDISYESVETRILKNDEQGYRPIELKNQMRIKGGKPYLNYIYNLLHQTAKRKRTFSNYDFKLFSSFAEMRNEILRKEDQYGLSKLCSGYAWEWKSRKDNSLWDIEIEQNKIRWNRDKTHWIGHMDSKHEMGSLYTLRGVDLNYIGLVIGPDLYLDEKDNLIKVDKKTLYSKDITKGSTDEEMKEYVLNLYAVLLSRAIEGTYVYVCDTALRKYLRTFIESA